ncbi:MAG: SMP-30/gluconolactonase/LRE family protein [Bacteroidetes bacterium]|nr:MAG: SMP-30/gluconolactonase/LRE family protein [Bacteroidota bacterium]
MRPFISITLLILQIAPFRSLMAQTEFTLFQAQDFTPAGGFTPGIEGPAVGPDGYLYAVNFAEEGTIGRVSPEGQATVFLRLPEGSIANGIRFGRDGGMYIADYAGHNILLLPPGGQSVRVFAHEDRMHQPNDIAISDSDMLFASDPDWAHASGQLWRIDQEGHCHLLETDMGTTNGIEVSPDGQWLYVNESVQRRIWVYRLAEDGTISDKKLFHQFPDHGLDGMRCDVDGNLYVTRYGKGTVAKLSPEGKVLNEIRLTGQTPSNLAFGGPDGRTVYVTLADRGCVETFRADRPGRSWTLRQH